MQSSSCLLVALISCLGAVCAQQVRNPPGVNPNQYQQQHQGQHPPPPPPPPQGQQQFQQQPQQFQQQQQQFQPQPQFQGQPVQHQQVQHQQVQHQQMQHQQVQHQRAPQQQHQQRVLHRDVKHEREHMKEHMEVPIDTSNMSEQELQFHYFKMHDADGNNKLDGCELVKSLIHWHDGEDHEGHDHNPPEHYEDAQLTFLIDPVLSNDDVNRDGMIDYAEYIAAQIKNKMGLRVGEQPISSR